MFCAYLQFCKKILAKRNLPFSTRAAHTEIQRLRMDIRSSCMSHPWILVYLLNNGEILRPMWTDESRLTGKSYKMTNSQFPNDHSTGHPSRRTLESFKLRPST